MVLLIKRTREVIGRPPELKYVRLLEPQSTQKVEEQHDDKDRSKPDSCTTTIPPTTIAVIAAATAEQEQQHNK
jgi:hypothetical protein